MTPKQRYQRELAREGFSPDAAQAEAIEHLDRLWHALAEQPAPSLMARLGALFRPPPRPLVPGLYLWGGVGRGKTWLVDAFYDSLPFAERQRVHFHRFMRGIHARLRALKDTADPLQRVGDDLAAEVRVLCLDEFHVGDITDAMLLGGLLQVLFERGVTLVATSNEAPDRLYWDGLQRERFLPAIDLLKRHTAVLNVDGGVDYRLRALEQAEIYHWPLDADAETALERAFQALAPEPGTSNTAVGVEGRDIPARRLADGVVWFDFDALCGGPRSVTDYIEIGRCFQTVLLSDVPVLETVDDDRARRFIHLVDEFYDRNVKLIVSAAAAPSELYAGRRLTAPFGRTVSRLQEMQSREYLARPHLSD